MSIKLIEFTVKLNFSSIIKKVEETVSSILSSQIPMAMGYEMLDPKALKVTDLIFCFEQCQAGEY